MSQSRPSRACTTCKQRRIKCDEGRPICQRCLRAGRQCAYATDFDRVHRDETRRTQRRATQARSAAGSANNPGQPARRGRGQPPASASGSASASASAATPIVTLPLPVRSSAGTGAGSGGKISLAALPPFVLSAPPGTETTAFVAGHEVDPDVALAAGWDSRFFWRSQRTSPSAYDAQIYSPADVAAGANLDVTSDGAIAGTSTLPSTSRRIAASDGSGSGSDDASPSPAATLSLPIGDLALCYFASNFMLMPWQPYGGTYFEFIVPVLRDQPPDSAVQFALRACAFSALGNRWVSDTVDFHAIGISQYTAALARTTQCLKDPRHSTTDATLAAVLLLGLFEGITARKELFAWRSHIEGAVQIVQNRGPRKLRTRTEQLLFNSVRIQMMALSMTADPPPSKGINWWLCESVLDSATARSQRFSLEVSQLRRELDRQIEACARQKPAGGPPDFRTYLLRVRAIDNELAAFLASLPASYRPYTVALVGEVPGGDYESAEAFPGRVDVYPDIAIARMWIVIWICRLVLSSFVVRCMALTMTSGGGSGGGSAAAAAAVDYRTTPEYAAEVRRCSRILSDVIAAIPYFLGSAIAATSSSSSSPSASDGAGQQRRDFGSSPRAPSPPMCGFACGDDHGHGMPKALAGYLLIWPLAGAYTHDCATKAQHAYMGGRLRYIGNTLGLRYALVCAATPFRYPSMMMYRDRLVVSGGVPPAMPLAGRGRGAGGPQLPKTT